MQKTHWTVLVLVSISLVAPLAAQEPAPTPPAPAAQEPQPADAPPAAAPAADAQPAEASPAETPPAVAPNSEPKQPAPTPSEPATAAAPAEQPAAAPQLNDNGEELVRLEFREQEWLPALEWLAGKLKLNLDWRTLPEGNFNLHSAKPYTIAEAEDLINMQLLARGFTLLKRGEVLRLEPLKEIDITLVPRVEPETLVDLPKHSIVRVSFPLNSMLAADAATDLKPLLSPYGSMHPLVAANRLEVMDAVVNLREVHRLLSTTDSGQGKRQHVLEIKVKNRKAKEIAPLVRQLLGLPPDGAPPATTQMQLDIEQTRLRAEAVRQLGGNAKEMLKEKKPDVFLVVNEKENSILVHAPPEKMHIARQAIESLDKEAPPGETAWDAINKVKTYSVAGYDPTAITALLRSLQEIGNLSSETRLQYDAPNQRLIAVAGPDDQLTIARLIEQFRGERRSAHIVPMTTLDPEYAVNAIKLLLKPAERPVAAGDGKFEIEADLTHDRLLLWATANEVAEVRELLSKLESEAAGKNATSDRLLVVPLGGADFRSVAEQLRRVWKDYADAPLVIQSQSEEAPAAPTAPAPPAKTTSENGAPEGKRGKVVFASTSAPAEAAEEAAQDAGDVPAVRIIEGKNGDLMIVSRDPKLAASARQILQQLTPSAEDVRIVTLKHAQAANVKLHLDEVLPKVRVRPASRLDPVRPTPLIQVDSRLNRLLIQHCTPEQWDVVNQVVMVLDVPADDPALERKQVVHRLRYRRAVDVAKALKEAYKDLMEDRTRAAQAPAALAALQRTDFSRGLAATSRNPEFAGLLSIGVDESANLLIINAPAYMIEEIVGVVEEMDTREDGTSIAVVPLNKQSVEFRVSELNKAIEALKKARQAKK